MSTTAEAIEVRPFQIDISDDALADLRRRIVETRWPSKELVDDRSQGVQLATTRRLQTTGRTSMTSARRGAAERACRQFTTRIDGVDIHFIHVKSRHENALPLVMTHGWPGSVIELLDAIGPLTDPTAHGGPRRTRSTSCSVHARLGFSSEPAELGWTPAARARPGQS